MHLKKCVKEGQKELGCGKCSYVTTDKSNLNKHIKIHQKNKLEFYCDNCEEVYSSKVELKKHSKTHISKIKPAKVFSCEICNKNFGYKHVLERHTKEIHKKGAESSVGFGIFDKPVKKKGLSLYQCDQCGYSTKKAKDLEKHIYRMHTNSKKKTDLKWDQ